MSKIVLYLSSIISLRFLGLFIVLPILSIYAIDLKNSNEFLVGLAIGGYALTQMIFQVPFGILSDKIGRKTSIVFGLALFLIGSIICAVSDDIYIFLFGRFLQGSGAIGAVVSAMISDFTTEEQRSKAMAMMGGSIALSFALAMLLGPLIGGYFGVDKLFFITAFLVFVAILILVLKIPEPPKVQHTQESVKITTLLQDKNLAIMNVTNFLQKGLMTLTFLIVPIMFINEFGWEKTELIKVYLPALILGVIAMAPSAILAEKKGKFKDILILGIALFATAYFIIGFNNNEYVFVVGVAVFFIAFNIHEPIMQSLTSKLAKASQKGTALGIFNSFGYLGTFLGGVFGSYFIKNQDLQSLSTLIILISSLWVMLIVKMENPANRKNLYIDLALLNEANISNLNNLEGVIESFKNEKTLTVKYNIKSIDEDRIKEVLQIKG